MPLIPVYSLNKLFWISFPSGRNMQLVQDIFICWIYQNLQFPLWLIDVIYCDIYRCHDLIGSSYLVATFKITGSFEPTRPRWCTLQSRACDSLWASDVVSVDATQLSGTPPALIALSFTICLSLDTCPFLLAGSILLSLSVCLLSVTPPPPASLHQRSLWWVIFLLPPSCAGEVLMSACVHTYCS